MDQMLTSNPVERPTLVSRVLAALYDRATDRDPATKEMPSTTIQTIAVQVRESDETMSL